MATAEQVRPERRQRGVQLINELQNERKDLWALYCQIGEMKPFDDVDNVKPKLVRFSELLVDYVALGHFGLYERIMSGNERRAGVMSLASSVYSDFAEVTEISVYFNDKYEKFGETSSAVSLKGLSNDLSLLGESLAKRFDLEDQLCALMQR